MKTVVRKKISQQLVEFLLVAPFLVIILGILTEYAYALNINMTINQGLKTITSSSYCSKVAGVNKCYGLYSQIKPGMSESDIRTLVTNGFIQYLSDNNVPNTMANNIEVGYEESGQTVVFFAGYTYIPAFTLPNVYFKFMPDKFNFLATSAVPVAFLKPNNYNSSIKSKNLDNIWSGTADFSSQDKFNAAKKGIIKDDSEGGRGNFIFLIPYSILTTADPPINNPYELVNWWGGNYNGQRAVDVATGIISRWWYEPQEIIVQTGTDADGNPIYGTQIIQVLKSAPEGSLSGYTNGKQIVFVHDSDATDFGSMSWNPSGASDLSPSSVNGALKRMVSLTDSSSLSIGSYEPMIDVASYNTGAIGGTTYTVDYFGSTKIVHTATDNIGIVGASTTSGSYNFGSRVNHD